MLILVFGLALAADRDGDGYDSRGGDCDDRRANVYPGAPETCDTRDNDCDGAVDEGVLRTYYTDADGDGYGDPELAVQACRRPAGTVTNARDCNDTADVCYPGSFEGVCESLSDCDCDGSIEAQCSWTDLPEIAHGAAGSYLGLALATGTDLTGDGVADLAAGAPYYDGAGNWSGLIEVYPGPVLGASTSVATLEPTYADAMWGFYLDAPDLDGDGYGDLVTSDLATGEVLAWYGPLTGALTEADAGWALASDATYGGARHVSSGGDLDGNGVPDLLVGYPGYSRGSFFVAEPGSGGSGTTADLSAGVYTNRRETNLGYHGAANADVDGDGQDDAVVGMPGTTSSSLGEVRVFYGPLVGAVTISASDVTVTGTGSDAMIGADVGVTDDLDGDGLPELYIPRTAGACLMGVSTPGSFLTTSAPIQVLGPEGELEPFYAAEGNAVVTDLDADGEPDLVVGNAGTDPDYLGMLAVLRGPVATGTLYSEATMRWYGGDLYEGVGSATAVLGDGDEDGRPELVTSVGTYSGYGYVMLLDGDLLR